MRSLLKKVALFVSFLAFVLGLLNYTIIKGNMNSQRSAHCTPLNINIEQTNRSKTQSDTSETVQNPTYTFQNNILCLDQTRCGHVHFKEDPSLPTFLTKDFLVLQNRQQFLVVSRHFNPQHSEHLLFFTYQKDIHLKHAKVLNFHSFKDSNIFVFQSDKLYIVYLIEDRHIDTCLFLEKTTPNYVQHIIPIDDSHFVALSLPKRKQIMVQLFNYRTKRVERVIKKALPQWIQKYKHTVSGKSITLTMQSATDSKFIYRIDQSLNIIQSSKQSRFRAQIKPNTVDCRPLTLIKVPMLKQLIIDLLNRAKNTFNRLKDHLLYNTSMPSYYQLYSPYYPPTKIVFKSQNKIVNCQSSTNQCDVMSLGKYMIPTATPVFHNQDRQPDLEHINKLDAPPKTFTYVNQDGIHTEEYIFVYEVHPKTEVEWVGLAKTHLDFYPYNKVSEVSRYVRTEKYTMVFEGSKYKGRWASIRSSNEVYQEIINPPNEVMKNIWQGHRSYYTLFADLTIVQNKVFQVKLLDGASGRQMRVLDIQGKYTKDNVFIRMIDNQLILALYDEATDKTKLAKVQFYFDQTSKNRDLLELIRQYSIQSKIIAFSKIDKKYYVSTSSGGVVSLFSMSYRIFNNRRSLLDQKNKSPFQKKMVLEDLPPYSNNLEFEGTAVYIDGVTHGEILEMTGSVNFIGRFKDKEEYVVFDFDSLIEDRIGYFRKWLEVKMVMACLVAFPIILLMSCVFRIKRVRVQKQEKLEKDVKGTEKPEKIQKTGKPQKIEKPKAQPQSVENTKSKGKRQKKQ